MADGTLSESTKDTAESKFRDAAALSQAKKAYSVSYAAADPMQSLVEDGTITSPPITSFTRHCFQAAR